MKELRDKVVSAARSLDDYRRGLDTELAANTVSKLKELNMANQAAAGGNTSAAKQVAGAKRAYEQAALETEMDRRNKKREMD